MYQSVIVFLYILKLFMQLIVLLNDPKKITITILKHFSFFTDS